ncbi:hypothetical protein BGW39_000411 [Mortierella sp. 14UC]|nr:hypothetical protein BGW39_000411 [Mortierella sp. 14UC]
MDLQEPPSQQQQDQDQKRPTTPFEIPEILHQILSHVQEPTLSRSVPLVNRQWLTLSQPLILRTVRWGYQDLSKDQDALEDRLRRLEFANRFEVEFNHEDTNVQWYWFAELVARARLAPKKDRKQPGKAEEYLKEPMLLKAMPLKELSMAGWGASDVLARMFVCLESLTHLEVMDHITSVRWTPPVNHALMDDAGTIFRAPLLDLMGIFSCCPLLQSLKLASTQINSPPMLDSPWVPVETSPKGRKVHFSTRSLETLIIEGFVFFHKDLEELLSVSPRMKVLKVINREARTRDGTSIFAKGFHRYTVEDLYKHLDRIGLVLETFHYSDHYLGLRNQDHTKEIQRFSKSKEWTFVEGDLSPKLVQDLLTVPNVVTTLELLNVCDMYVVAKGLHTYLCSSPHLIHLRAAKTPYPVELMDVHDNYLLGQCKEIKTASTSSGRELVDNGDATGEAVKEDQKTKQEEKEKQEKKGIWMCRNLETLHLGFKILSGPYCKRDTINARIIFGYLTRVCPDLQELHLHSKDCRQPTPFPTLRLKTGFCLLSQLQHLRQLDIGTLDAHLYPSGIPQRYLDENAFFRNWMFLGRREQLRLKKAEENMLFLKAPYDRRSEVGRWRGLMEREDERVLARDLEMMSIAWMGPGANAEGEATEEQEQGEGEEMSMLREQLKRVGLLTDVWTMVRDMDTTAGFVSCPNLERFRVCSPREYGSYPTF